MAITNQQRLVAGMTAAVALLSGGKLDAAQLSATMPVSLTAVNTCSNLSATTLDFGQHQAGANNVGVSASATLTMTCTSGASWQIVAQSSPSQSNASLTCLDAASEPYGNFLTGFVTVAAQFRLYKDANGTAVLGTSPSCGSGTPLTGTGTGAAQAVPIYGKIIQSDTTVKGQFTGYVNLMITL